MQAMRNTVAKGFTLVEILIVVVILGILAAIVVPQFTNAANEARGGNVATQVSTVENQLELFAARNNGSYPTVVELNADADNGLEGWSVMINDDYLKDLPTNPFTGSASVVANTTFDDADPSISVFDVADSTDGWVYDVGSGNVAAIRP